MDSSDAPLWYVIHTKPRAEERTLESLRQKVIHTFLPHLLVHRRHGSRRWQALEPLFPGYLFACFPLQPECLYRVRWTPGVKRLLGDEDAPIPVPDGVVRHLQEREGERGFIVPNQPSKPGTRVRFRSGPFELLEGVIERSVSRADRVRVLLTLMKTPLVIETDIAELERI